MKALHDKKNWPWIAAVAVVVLMAIVLRLQGRAWFCDCGQLRFWIDDPRSNHTSQHFLDPYSATHFLHGLIFYWIVSGLFSRWNWPWQCLLALSLEAGWEIFENTQFVINRYRSTTASLGYEGDSVLNSLGDVVACWAGLLAARALGWRRSLVLLLAIELTLLVTIRDSLLLNIWMLCWDVEWLKTWQAG